jgi:hypothetical protein
MTTSTTYTFSPALSDIMIAAFSRCQIRRTQLSVDHLNDAAMAANLLQVEWANRQVNLWTVELMSTALVAGTATYTVDPATVMIMAAYISTPGPPVKDRIITSLDRDTYASFPDKTTRGQPTVYWFNKTIAPTITLWQPPDTSTDTLKYYRARQIQDASLPNGLTPEVPYRFLEAYVAALAAKISLSWAPGRTADLTVLARDAFTEAKNRDVENSPLRIVPALASYTSGVY